jgi:hypothetical protein
VEIEASVQLTSDVIRNHLSRLLAKLRTIVSRRFGEPVERAKKRRSEGFGCMG